MVLVYNQTVNLQLKWFGYDLPPGQHFPFGVPQGQEPALAKGLIPPPAMAPPGAPRRETATIKRRAWPLRLIVSL